MTTSSCSCHGCQAACTNKPGWFMPGEIEKAAAFKGMDLPDFFKAYLGVDWWEADEPTFVIAPATRSMDAGDMYPGNPSGTCVFFEDGKCSIHEVKPFECAQYMHGDTGATTKARHREVFEAWQPHQGQIRGLLGREPQATEWSGGLFGGLFGGGFSDYDSED